jgi:hypothetical protein
MVSRTTLATLPGHAPHQRLRVGLVQGRDGRLSLELCEQDHAEGIGWFDQRTLRLDPQQLRQLKAVLCPAIAALTDEPCDGSEPPATIPFPGRFDDVPRRSVAGEGA